MTSRETTSLLTLPEEDPAFGEEAPWRERLAVWTWGAITWPFLAISLWGGTRASKRRLLARVGLAEDALPNLGSWKADTGFLHRIVDAVERLRPRTVVELGAGASSLVCARALQLHGGGILYSYDQHGGFVDATRQWLRQEGVDARMHHAPLVRHDAGRAADWPGPWYDLTHLPESIDLLIIDGPPWTLHPQVRGAAEALFDRLTPGAIILLDDAARPGERAIARKWARNWPGIAFDRPRGGTKGTLVGRKVAGVQVFALPRRSPQSVWKRAAAIATLLATGWIGNDLTRDFTRPAEAASFIDEADASLSASELRQRMASQVESAILDRAEIERMAGLALPAIPHGWRVRDVQLYPSDRGTALTVSVLTPHGEPLALFASRAETPAGSLPLITLREGRSIAYWEEGPFAYALSGDMSSAALLVHAAGMAAD